MDNSLDSIFAPLMGKYVWSVKAGVGTFLTLEFGSPHLVIRDPRTPSAETTERVRSGMARRRVTVMGEHHLWLEGCWWSVNALGASAQSDVCDDASLALNNLDGQILVSISEGGVSGNFSLEFDLGGVLSIKVNQPLNSEESWSIFSPSGHVFTYP